MKFIFLFALFVITPIAHAFEEKEFVLTCLKDYVKTNGSKEVKANCLSYGFASKWQKMIISTGADPLLLAQDEYESWKTEAVITEHDPKLGRMKVILGKKGEEHCLIIGMKDTRIDSSTACKSK